MDRIGFRAAWDFGRAVAGLARGGESARSATVTSVDEDGTVWVRMAGAESEVPLDGTLASVQVGDTVTVGWRGGAPAGEGNASDPSAGGRSVSVVRESARVAQAVAQEAQAVADAINQHFWADANGIHVTEAAGDPTTEHNILINSLGILLRKALNPLVSITQSAIAFYDGAGTAAANIVASFGTSGAQIGKASSAHVNVTSTGMEMYAKNGSTLSKVVEVGYDTVGTDTLATVNVGTNGGADGALIKVGGLDIKALAGELQISSQGQNPSSLSVDRIDAQDMTLLTALPTTSGGTGSKAYGTIVTQDISTAVSVPTGASWHTLGSVDLAAGDWIVSYNTQFDNNATGRRAMVLHNVADTAGASSLRQGGVTSNAVSGGGTYLNACRVLHLTSAATYYLNVYQTSGAALNTYGYIRAFRLK